MAIKQIYEDPSADRINIGRHNYCEDPTLSDKVIRKTKFKPEVFKITLYADVLSYGNAKVPSTYC